MADPKKRGDCSTSKVSVERVVRYVKKQYNDFAVASLQPALVRSHLVPSQDATSVEGWQQSL
jgi:hypothetical protein